MSTMKMGSKKALIQHLMLLGLCAVFTTHSQGSDDRQTASMAVSLAPSNEEPGDWDTKHDVTRLMQFPRSIIQLMTEGHSLVIEQPTMGPEAGLTRLLIADQVWYKLV